MLTRHNTYKPLVFFLFKLYYLIKGFLEKEIAYFVTVITHNYRKMYFLSVVKLAKRQFVMRDCK